MIARRSPAGTCHPAKQIPVRTDSHGIYLPTESKERASMQRLDELSRGLMTDCDYRKACYRQAAVVARDFGARMGEEIKRQVPMYLVSRLH